MKWWTMGLSCTGVRGPNATATGTCLALTGDAVARSIRSCRCGRRGRFHSRTEVQVLNVRDNDGRTFRVVGGVCVIVLRCIVYDTN